MHYNLILLSSRQGQYYYRNRDIVINIVVLRQWNFVKTTIECVHYNFNISTYVNIGDSLKRTPLIQNK